jgi:hypothetical protein
VDHYLGELDDGVGVLDCASQITLAATMVPRSYSVPMTIGFLADSATTAHFFTPDIPPAFEHFVFIISQVSFRARDLDNLTYMKRRRIKPSRFIDTMSDCSYCLPMMDNH